MHKVKRPLSLVLVVCMLLSALSVGALAVEIAERPANGTTTAQPFAKGTGGSDNFRIPGIVTLDDGTLIAACDARWNHTGDGAGLDTIVSVSTDNGATWTYTFANYLGDNGNTYNRLSTCIIDPAIGTDGTTVYLIADLFPAGIALNTSRYSPVAGSNGFDANGNLMLRALADDTVAIGEDGYNTMAAAASYDYYLDLQTLQLYAYGVDGAEDTLVEGYTVDAYFNIVSTDGTVNTNLYFSDSPYQPYPTDYLYMTTSTDGLNWSEPTLLNLQEPAEQTLLIGPGNGTYSQVRDHMIFTGYEYTSGYQRTSLIWRDADGVWHRTADATGSSWSSEATSVVLADGTVRCFYRDGYTTLRYTDFVWSEEDGNYIPDTSAYEVNTAATKTYNNQISSLKYSQQVNGKDLILVSTADSGSNSRVNGTIYAFLVDEDNSMELTYSYDIIPNDNYDYYAYSCITEMDDGSIALLYEGNDGGQGYGTILFKVLPIDDILARDNDVTLRFADVDMLTGDVLTLTDNTGYYGSADLSELDVNVATVELSGSETVTDAAQLGTDATYSGDYIDLSDCVYTFTASDDDTWVISSTDAEGNAVYLYPGHTASSGYPNGSDPVSLQILEGYEDGTFCLYSPTSDNTNGSAAYLYFDRSGLRWDRVSSPGTNATWQTNVSMLLYRQVEGGGSEEIPGFERVTDIADVTDGNYLVVGPGSDGNYYALYPNTSTASRYCQIAKILGRTTVGYTELTFTGVAAGYTEVQIGSTVYRITVANYNESAITLPVGTSVTVLDESGDYSGADLSGVDTGIAEVALNANIETAFVAWTGSDPSYTDAWIDPADCLYTATANDDGTWLLSAVTSDGTTVYIDAHAGAGNGGHPNRTYETALTLVNGSDGAIKIKDSGGTLHFWDTDATKRHWDQCTGDSCTGHHLRWFRPAEEGETCDILPGFVAVTDVSEIVSGGQYLICGYADGTYYALHPTASTASKFGHVARLGEYSDAGTEIVVTGVHPGTTGLILGRTQYTITVTGDVVPVALDTVLNPSESFLLSGTADLSALDTSVAAGEISTIDAAQLGTDATFSGELTELSKLLYTFTANEDGTYVVSSTTAEGETVYLQGYAQSNGYPNVTEPVAITIGTGFADNTFTLSGNGGYLFFWRDGKNYYDRVTSTSGFESGVSFHLYAITDEGLSVVTEVADGGQYLILAQVDETFYALYPTTSKTTRYAQIAKVTEGSALTFTAVGEGQTSLTVPGAVFEITVTEHVHTWDEGVTTEPGCETDGHLVYTCQTCGQTDVTVLPALGHTEVIDAAKVATCTEEGLTAGSHCSTCGEVLVPQETVPALGHDERVITILPATCVTDGMELHICNRCMDVELVRVAATGHNYEKVTHHGHTIERCTECGHVNGTFDFWGWLIGLLP